MSAVSCKFYLATLPLTLGALCSDAGVKPFFVDLSAVANVAAEDDGIAGNGAGGWTDEGINDMYLYPPLPVGKTVRNGHAFFMLDSSDGAKPVAVMLRGNAAQSAKPKSVRVEVPNVAGAYVTFVHNAVGGSQTREGETMAVYTIEYADGDTAEIAMRKGVELRDWWCRQWWDNSERAAWPVHMGRNIYTMKWRSLIGLWATQWPNPRPDAPIARITFASQERGAPVVWAVTIDDADAHADEAALKRDAWGNPPMPPDGYFEKKLALERALVYDAAVAEGHVAGLRAVALIRPDMLAVTVDPALTRTAAGTNPDAEKAAQQPHNFIIRSSADAAYASGKNPVRVGRDTYEYWNGNIGAFVQNSIYWHTFYLQLPTPMQNGCAYEIDVPGIDPAMRRTMNFVCDARVAESAAIKVNQVAYSTRSARRYAYLGWWAGDLGAVDYAAFSRFEVVDERTGEVALRGDVTAREDAAGNTGENVREMDISALGAGAYHIRIPGLGRSARFAVGGDGMRALYTATQRAFYHQRCGFPLEEPYTRFVKPACHLWVYESGKMADDPHYAPAPDEKKKFFKGGYHDAADFDCFTYHLRATAQNLDAFEMFPGAFRDGDLNIPESGNGIPDVLDEAEWALRFWMEQQTPDGAVPKGRCNDQDSRRQNQVKWGAFGIFLPDPVSNYEFAAVAGSFARLYETHDAALAKRYRDSATRAYEWAAAQPPDEKDEARDAFRLWAAAALYRATGEARFNDVVMTAERENRLKIPWRLRELAPLMRWQYIRCERAETDASIREKIKKELRTTADAQIAKLLESDAYRWGGDSARGMGWGNANGGGYYADVLLRVWFMTREQTYLDAACLNADFQLGCNPLSKTFISGMGSRPPRHPQISEFLYEKPGKRGATVAGITVYGLTDRDPAGWYPAERPRLRRWRDIGNGGAEVSSEFTVSETLGASAMLYAALYALESEEDVAP